MTPLFTPRLLERNDSETRFELLLEPHEPYLDNHRPGGTPLFATVLAVEAMAAAVELLSPGLEPAVRELEVGPPCQPGDRTSHCVAIRVRTLNDCSFHCTLASESAGAEPVEHFRARFVPRELAARASGLPGIQRRLGNGTGVVSEALIYAHFFHGAAFRVVHAAHWNGTELIAELRHPVPPLRRSGDATRRYAATLLEFALQSAGLMELARSGRSMIPRSIAALSRVPQADEAVSLPLCARARPARLKDAIDIDVYAPGGEPVLSVAEYRTVPFPFASHDPARTRLIAALRAAAPQSIAGVQTS